MLKIRKLQYIGKQYLLNVPVEIIKEAKFKKGDYLEIMQGQNSNFSIRKIAENDMPRAEVSLESLKNEAVALAGGINALRSALSPAEFSFQLAQFSHIQAKIRKLEKKK